MPEISLDGAAEAKQEAQGSGRENDAGIPEDQRVDYENETVAEGKIHAAALVTFDRIARINIQTYGDDRELLEMEQNLEGAGKYGFDVELTLANPEVVDGQVWKQAGEYPEYKVIGDPESDDNSYELRENVIKDDDGNPTDVEVEGIGGLGSSSWDGQPLEDGFDTDYFQVTINSRRASRILGALDTAGQWFATQDGDVVEGLFETPPNFGTEVYDSDEDGYPRLVGYPELRADMVGQPGAIAATWGDSNSSGNRAKNVDIFRVVDDGLEALTPLQSDDEAYALPEYPRGNNTMWSDADAAGGAAEEGDVGADAEPETDADMTDAAQMMSDDDNSVTETDGITYSDLNDNEQSFVDDAVEVLDAEDSPVDSVNEIDDFEDRVATHGGAINVSADVLADVVASQSN